MSDESVSNSTLTGAIESSVVLAAARRTGAGSAVCAQAGAAGSWLRRARARVIVGLGGEWSDEREKKSTARVLALAADSWLVAELSAWGHSPLTAWRASGLRRALEPVLNLDLPHRVRLAGWVIVVTVVTHTVLLGLLGAPVGVAGWAIRAGLLIAGSAIMWRPRSSATAWQDRVEKRERGSGSI